MGEWLDDDTYQCDDEKEMMSLLGLDPETIEGDYAEAFHHMLKVWNAVDIDKRFQ